MSNKSMSSSCSGIFGMSFFTCPRPMIIHVLTEHAPTNLVLKAPDEKYLPKSHKNCIIQADSEPELIDQFCKIETDKVINLSCIDDPIFSSSL